MGILDFLFPAFLNKKNTRNSSYYTELEAKLLPVTNSTATGKGELEVKLVGPSIAHLEFSLKHTNLETGSRVDVFCYDTILASFYTESSYNKKHLEINDSVAIELLKEGAPVEFRVNGNLLYSGIFYRD